MAFKATSIDRVRRKQHTILSVNKYQVYTDSVLPEDMHRLFWRGRLKSFTEQEKGIFGGTGPLKIV